MGNIFGRWPGKNERIPSIATGSHIDAIPLSGMYDGTVGVIGALHAIKYLKEKRYEPMKSIDVIMFTSEEPTRFKIGCIGSRVMSGNIDEIKLNKLRDDENKSFIEAAREVGYGEKEIINHSKLNKNKYSHFIELHIEQGIELEKEKLNIGIVTSIAAPSTLKVIIEGNGGHAGSVLMHERNDALVAGSELVIEVEKIVKEEGTGDTVGTTGKITVEPNAVNSIPRRVILEIDVRDVDVNRLEIIIDRIINKIKEIKRKRKLEIEYQIVNMDIPMKSDEEIIGTIENVTNELGLKSKKMISRAYHDTLFMSNITKCGMIFIPCKDGISHKPEEYASPDDINNGIIVLANTLMILANESNDYDLNVKNEL